MGLTPEEKSAGRVFREWCSQQLSEMPAAQPCSPYTVWFRHECRDSEQGAGTWAMPLKQHYWYSPAYLVSTQGLVQAFSDPDWAAEAAERFAELAEAGLEHLSVVQAIIPQGLFSYQFREGTCPRCGLLVRSGTGRFVLAASHPPQKGAVVDWKQPEHGAVPAAQAGDQASPGSH